MSEETTYTDDQIIEISEQIAKKLREMCGRVRPYLYRSEEYNRGPFGILSAFGNEYNPLGKFPVEPEVLTMKQKTIVTKIIGKAMNNVGVDHPD